MKINLDQAAEISGVSKRTIYNWITAGFLVAEKYENKNKSVLVERDIVIELAHKSKTGQLKYDKRSSAT